MSSVVRVVVVDIVRYAMVWCQSRPKRYLGVELMEGEKAWRSQWCLQGSKKAIGKGLPFMRKTIFQVRL